MDANDTREWICFNWERPMITIPLFSFSFTLTPAEILRLKALISHQSLLRPLECGSPKKDSP